MSSRPTAEPHPMAPIAVLQSPTPAHRSAACLPMQTHQTQATGACRAWRCSPRSLPHTHTHTQTNTHTQICEDTPIHTQWILGVPSLTLTCLWREGLHSVVSGGFWNRLTVRGDSWEAKEFSLMDFHSEVQSYGNPNPPWQL